MGLVQALTSFFPVWAPRQGPSPSPSPSKMLATMLILGLGSLASPVESVSGPPQCLLDPFRTVPTRTGGGFCNVLSLNTDDIAAGCSSLALLGQVVEYYANPNVSLQCWDFYGGGLKAPKSTDLRGFKIPMPLPDRRRRNSSEQLVLPEQFTAQLIMKAEGATYYWYFRNILNLYNWSPCQAVGSSAVLPTPSGWTQAALIPLYQGQQSELEGLPFLPFAVIYKRTATARSSCISWWRRIEGWWRGDMSSLCGSSQLAIVLRGSISGREWGLDLEYQTVDGGDNYGPGSVHSGFATVANEVWSAGVADAIDQFLIDTQGTYRSITFSGWSIGAGVAQLLAVRAAKYLAAGVGRGPVVSVVQFGAPAAGDATFAANYNSRINSRSLAFQPDLFTQVPCTPLMIGCPDTPTANPPSNVWSYKAVGGVISYPASAMPFNLLGRWSQLNTLSGQQLCNVDSFSTFIDTTHTCSYLCMTSSYVGDRENLCLIDLPSNLAGTQCWYGPEAA